MLSSLYRKAKTHRPSSPTSTQASKPSLQSSGAQIDVRALALVSFRDRVILPLFKRLHERLTTHKDALTHVHARMQQMLLVLVSQRSPWEASLSLTASAPAPAPGESAVTRLLRALHAPIATLPRRPQTAGAPSFLSAGLPRDRRGRIAQKYDMGGLNGNGIPSGRPPLREERMGLGMVGVMAGGRGRLPRGAREEWDDSEADVDTPRGGVAFPDVGRERDKEFLESLRYVVCLQRCPSHSPQTSCRSPDPENTERMSMGGWGLGPGREEPVRIEDAYEDEEPMDWDQAQVRVFANSCMPT